MGRRKSKRGGEIKKWLKGKKTPTLSCLSELSTCIMALRLNLSKHYILPSLAIIRVMYVRFLQTDFAEKKLTIISVLFVQPTNVFQFPVKWWSSSDVHWPCHQPLWRVDVLHWRIKSTRRTQENSEQRMLSCREHHGKKNTLAPSSGSWMSL